tara:strand:- start:7683 stop:8369 length:687 start_codon:yes stop_codon:yes gene_type:complete
MARAGFAGSLVVDANWKGRNLNRGMRDSKKRVESFGKSVRRIVAGVALGAGAFAAGKGLMGLLKMSKAGSEAWSNWLIAWNSLKNVLSKLLAGPASSLLNWASEVVGKAAAWLSQFDSIGDLWDHLLKMGKAVLDVYIGMGKAIENIALQKAIDLGILDAAIAASTKIMQIWQKIVQYFQEAATAISETVLPLVFGGPRGSSGNDSGGIYQGFSQLAAGAASTVVGVF